MRRNAARDGDGKCAARTVERDHEILDGKRRETGASGNERNAADGRFEGPNPEHISHVDEFAGKSGSRVHARFGGAGRLKVAELPKINPKTAHAPMKRA